MEFTKACSTCKRHKPFSYYKPLSPNVKTINRGSKPLNRKFNAEDLEDVCATCKEKRSFRFERAEDHIQEDYIYELQASAVEFTEEEQEWWTLQEEAPPKFSFPFRKQWFKCKGCDQCFPKEAKFLNSYKYCEPCGKEYNRKQRMKSYYRKKGINNNGTEDS